MIKEELSFEVLSKYGKTKTHDSSIFLDVSDFELDDKIYISITTYQMHSLDQKLYYNFYDSTDMSDDYYTAPNYVYSGSQTKVSSFNSFEETYIYKIKKVVNSKYLYLYYYLYPPVTIENTKGDNSIVLIIVVIVIIVVVFAVIIIVAICLCRRRKRARAMRNIAYPMVTGYGISSYALQPALPPLQPGLQPIMPTPINVNVKPNYNANPQNNQIEPTAVGSDIRIKQNIIK